MRVFVWAFAPKPRLLVFGAIDFAAAVARVGAFLGYHVTVCDARPVFATASRFPEADEVVVDWPHRYLAAEHEAGRIDPRTVVTVLTHDPKFDVPLLEVALRLPEVAYVGAMGSRRTHDDRLERLREAGLTDEELDRLSSPIGLDLGARTPEETAISIAAEIIAGRWGGSGERLGGDRRPDPRRDEPAGLIVRTPGHAPRTSLQPCCWRSLAGCTSAGQPSTTSGATPDAHRRASTSSTGDPAPSATPDRRSAGPTPTEEPLPEVAQPALAAGADAGAAVRRPAADPAHRVRDRRLHPLPGHLPQRRPHRLRRAAPAQGQGAVPRRSCSTTATSSRRST